MQDKEGLKRERIRTGLRRTTYIAHIIFGFLIVVTALIGFLKGFIGFSSCGLSDSYLCGYLFLISGIPMIVGGMGLLIRNMGMMKIGLLGDKIFIFMGLYFFVSFSFTGMNIIGSVYLMIFGGVTLHQSLRFEIRMNSKRIDNDKAGIETGIIENEEMLSDFIRPRPRNLKHYLIFAFLLAISAVLIVTFFSPFLTESFCSNPKEVVCVDESGTVEKVPCNSKSDCYSDFGICGSRRTEIIDNILCPNPGYYFCGSDNFCRYCSRC